MIEKNPKFISKRNIPFSISKTILLLLMLCFFVSASGQTGNPLDIDGDGIPNDIDQDDDNDGIYDSAESVITYIQLNGFRAFSPASIPSTGLVTGNRLIKRNALIYLNVPYDAVLELTDVHAVSGWVKLLSSGDIALEDIYPNENPYFSYSIKFVLAGTATTTGTLIPATISNLAVTLADIDGNGSSSKMGDVAGYATSNNITGAPVVGGNLIAGGFDFGLTGLGGPAGTNFNYYRPAALTATSGCSNTSITGDPLYIVTTYQNTFIEGNYIYGVTGNETSKVGERKSQIFIRLGNINGVDSDGDGIINQYDLDSDNDGCSDSNEYYFNNSSAAPGQQFGQVGGAVAPVNADGSVNLPGAFYAGTYDLAILPGITISNNPLDQQLNPGDTATFSVTVTGGSGITTYLWQESVNGGANWTTITDAGIYSGATTNTLTITGVTNGMNNNKYRVLVTSSDYICGDFVSTAALLSFLNAAPIANDDNQSTSPLLEDGANGTVNVVANDTDPDGNPTVPVNGAGQFTVDLDTATAGVQTTITTTEGVWTLDTATGVVTFDPTNNYFGTATLLYSLCDPSGACDTATITFVVSSVNDAPVANNDSIATNYDTNVTIPVAGNDTDIDGTINVATIDLDPLTAGIQTTFTIAGQGTFTANSDGTVTFDPIAGFVGTTTPLNYVIQDNQGGISNTATITVTVGPCGSDPLSDCDNDGLINSQELLLGTNPNNPDTDGDGVLDGTEVVDNTNPLNHCESIEEHATIAQSVAFLDDDCDGDGLLNGLEFGDTVGHPFDSNGNGIPDYLEVNNHHLSNSDDELEIFNGVSPSSDDVKNNVFTIRNIEKYPNNSLQIFNRWGVIVYEAEGYGIGNKYFNGTSEGRATISASSQLPEDTYFYILKYVNSNGETKDRSGYLYLNR